MEKAYTMVGYGAGSRHIIEPVESTKHAERIRDERGVTRYFLIPEIPDRDHLAYLLLESGWEKVKLAEMLQTLCPKTLQVVG